MAIEDDIICRVQPLPGATTLIDTFDATAFTGAGSTSATTEGGEDAVRLQNGAVTKTIPDHNVDSSIIGSGMTIAIRYKAVEIAGGGSFEQVFSGSTNPANIQDTVMMGVTKNGTTDLRAKGWLANSVSVPSIGENGLVNTVVVQCKSASGVDSVDCWRDQSPAQPNRAPDFIKNDFFGAGSNVVNTASMGLPATSDIIILDYVIWARELTNAESSDIADDIRAILPIGGATTSVTTGTAVPTQTEADIVTGGKTIILTLTGDTFVTGTSSLDGIAAGSDSDIAASGTNWDSLIKTDLDNTNVVLSVGDTVATITLPAYASYDVPSTEVITWTIPAASLTTSGDPVVSAPTFTVTSIAVLPTITAELKNNTGQLLINEVGVTADVYDPTDGSLVVRKTGLTSNGSGIVTFSDAAMSPATGYNVVIELTSEPDLPGVERITSV